jgi:hypothetical protein
MGVSGTSLPPVPAVVPGQEVREPPEPRSRDRFRINLAKAAEL